MRDRTNERREQGPTALRVLDPAVIAIRHRGAPSLVADSTPAHHCRDHGAAVPGIAVDPPSRPLAAQGAIVPLIPGAAADDSDGTVIGSWAPPSSAPLSPAAFVHGRYRPK